MVKLFVLNGGSNVGKSTTLNLLIDLFQIISSRYEICFDPEHYEDVNDRWAWFIFEGKKQVYVQAEIIMKLAIRIYLFFKIMNVTLLFALRMYGLQMRKSIKENWKEKIFLLKV